MESKIEQNKIYISQCYKKMLKINEKILQKYEDADKKLKMIRDSKLEQKVDSSSEICNSNIMDLLTQIEKIVDSEKNIGSFFIE